LVQTQAPKAPAPSQDTPLPTPQQSDERKAPAGVEGKSEVGKEEVIVVPVAVTEQPAQVTDIPLPPQPKVAYFAITAFVYKMQDENSQRTWQLPKGTEVLIVPANGGWTAVTTKDGK